MVIVVEFFTANDDTPGEDVSAAIIGVSVAISPPVSHSIDHTSSPERNPCHLHQPHDQSPSMEQRDFDDQQQQESPLVVRSVDITLYPIIGRTFAVLLDHLTIFCGRSVQESTSQQHGPEAIDLRAVRIAGLFTFLMMLAMNCYPLFGDHARGHPQPKTHEVAHCRMQFQGQMCLATM